MNKVLHGVLQVFLTLCLASGSAAQTTADARTVQDLVDSLDQHITTLRALEGHLDTQSKIDREAILYRIDERSFKVLTELDRLARLVIEMCADEPQRSVLEQRLPKDLVIAVNAAFKRIDDLSNRIGTLTENLDSLSGGAFITLEA